jgi:U4/U6 small nuclear ribonucleoprotein PRP31
MSPGRALTPDEQASLSSYGKALLSLLDHSATFQRFVANQMATVAPNVVALVGSSVAASMLSLAGTLSDLSRVPSCNLLLFGAKQREAGGLNQGAKHANGLVKDATLVLEAAVADRPKAMKLVCNKLSLCARIDASGGQPDGSTGVRFRDEISKKITKMAEPDDGGVVKALPKPIMESSKKRGGRKVRAAKARFATTDVHKLQNKRSFGENNGEYGDDAMGLDMGMLGAARSNGALRVDAKGTQKAKVSNSKMAQKKRANMNTGAGGNSGFASSVVFTSTQGIELVNPDAAKKQKIEEANNKWFSQNAGFMSAMPK